MMHESPPADTPTQMNERNKDTARKPSRFQVYFWGIYSIVWFVAGVFGVLSWASNGATTLEILAYGFRFGVSGVALFVALWEYQKVVARGRELCT